MIHVIKRPRGIVTAVLVAALLGATALLSASPERAAAEVHDCPPGDFCLYVNADANGGIYHFEHSDRSLFNNRYDEANRDVTVADTARNVWNNGYAGEQEDVVIYARTRWRGASDCIAKGDFGALPRKWWNNIASYRWVTDTQCAAAELIDPPLGPFPFPRT